MAHEIQQRSFCSRLLSATCHEIRFRWERDKSGLYLLAIGIILIASTIALLSQPSFTPCMTWNYCTTNPAFLVFAISLAGTTPVLLGYGGSLLFRIYRKTAHPELLNASL